MNNLEVYHPDIEDIRIGGEYLVNWSRGYKETFEPYSPRVKENEGAYVHDISNLIHAMDDGYAEVIVPFLTSEQIEIEGWKKPNPPYMCHYPNEWGIYLFYINGNYRLHSIPSKHLIRIVDVRREENLFEGKCPDVNTFRYICKLLNIK